MSVHRPAAKKSASNSYFGRNEGITLNRQRGNCRNFRRPPLPQGRSIPSAPRHRIPSEAVTMNSKITAVKHETPTRSERFYIRRNFQPGKPSADMVRRLLLAHQAA